MPTRSKPVSCASAFTRAANAPASGVASRTPLCDTPAIMRYAALGGLLLLVAANASGQTVFEGRYGFETEYRFVDLTHTFARGPYLEALYTGVPGQNELYLGAGFQLRPTRGFTITPAIYAVFGKENDQQGVAVGGLVSVDRSGWKVLAFAGHFFHTSG